MPPPAPPAPTLSLPPKRPPAPATSSPPAACASPQVGPTTPSSAMTRARTMCLRVPRPSLLPDPHLPQPAPTVRTEMPRRKTTPGQRAGGRRRASRACGTRPSPPTTASSLPVASGKCPAARTASLASLRPEHRLFPNSSSIPPRNRFDTGFRSRSRSGKSAWFVYWGSTLPFCKILFCTPCALVRSINFLPHLPAPSAPGTSLDNNPFHPSFGTV